MHASSESTATEITLPAAGTELGADLTIPRDSGAIVIFAHGSGSSRFSPRNRAVAETLNRRGLSTLLLDLLSEREQEVDERTGHLRFDIALLAERLVAAIDWVGEREQTRGMRIGLFGASTGAAAALVAAAQRPREVQAVVSRGGRADMAGPSLPEVRAPALLIVGSRDEAVIRMNQEAAERLDCRKELRIVEGASHLFEEPGKLEEVAALAAQWFDETLQG